MEPNSKLDAYIKSWSELAQIERLKDFYKEQFGITAVEIHYADAIIIDEKSDKDADLHYTYGYKLKIVISQRLSAAQYMSIESTQFDNVWAEFDTDNSKEDWIFVCDPYVNITIFKGKI